MMFLALLTLIAPAPQQSVLEAHPPEQQQQGTSGLPQKPVPLTPPTGWITQRDYPSAAAGAYGTTRFRLTVNAEGGVMTCVITGSSGSKALDDQACRMLRLRARFQPARDSHGNPIPFTWNSWFAWRRP